MAATIGIEPETFLIIGYLSDGQPPEIMNRASYCDVMQSVSYMPQIMNRVQRNTDIVNQPLSQIFDLFGGA